MIKTDKPQKMISYSIYEDDVKKFWNRIEELESQLASEKARSQKLLDAVENIAYLDHRGNRSTESHLAFEAVQEYRKKEKDL